MTSQAVRRLHWRYYDSDPDWINGTDQFGSVVRNHLRPEMRILSLGAGPGRGLLHFDREVRQVVGLDPDEAIAQNHRVNYRVRGLGQSLPFKDNSFDLIYLDWVVEHLSSPAQMAREVYRVLNKDGVVTFRTGNLLHYSYAIAAATPNRFHKMLVPGDADPYPTYYRMNTVGRVRTIMCGAGFIEKSLTLMEPDPAYVTMSGVTFLVGVAYERLVNRFERLSPFRANILAAFRKP